MATVQLYCNQPATIYWAIGIIPSIYETTANDILDTLVAQPPQQGLLTNYTELADFYFRVYGFLPFPFTSSTQLTLYNLTENGNYQFKYFCANQMGLSSGGASITWTQPNNGAFLLKITLEWNATLTYAQASAVTCTLATLLSLPAYRLVNELA